jgi:hypothetical protein
MAFDKPGKPDAPATKGSSTPSGHFIARQGQEFWSGAGTSTGKSAGIPFGTPGAFDECVTRVTPHLGAGAKGYCAERFHDATGKWPGSGHGNGGK